MPSPHVVILSWDQLHFKGSEALCAQDPDHAGCTGASRWRVEEQSEKELTGTEKQPYHNATQNRHTLYVCK